MPRNLLPFVFVRTSYFLAIALVSLEQMAATQLVPKISHTFNTAVTGES
jgi:hypothetical protein